MAHLVLVRPLGFTALSPLFASEMQLLQEQVERAVDGDTGGTWDGPVILTAAQLNGSSSINTTGSIETTDFVTADVITGNTVGAVGTITAGTIASSRRMSADKTNPRTVNAQTINCAGGAANLTVDFTLYQAFDITLTDSGGSHITAVLATITINTTTVTVADRVQAGERFTLNFRTAQNGGLGLALTALPVSVTGYTKSDLIGPRGGVESAGGGAAATGGATDFLQLELEQVGTPLSPAFKIINVVVGRS